ncbi:MAG: DUF4867 family protein [Spirochaetia bacterium]|jgi:hypothetical protein|nr:DUF4867 family protein [Spirochaetia bacterium]
MLEIPRKLLETNSNLQLYSLNGPGFTSYGRLLNFHGSKKIEQYVETGPGIPTNGIKYVTSTDDIESTELLRRLSPFFAGMPVQIGYYVGHNSTPDSLEWHNGPQILIAATDYVLFLARLEEMDESYMLESNRCKAFYVPKGAVFVLKSGTIHSIPCEVHATGFRTATITERDTGNPLPDHWQQESCEDNDPLCKLLFRKNTYLIVHKEQKELISQGAHCRILGKIPRVHPF